MKTETLFPKEVIEPGKIDIDLDKLPDNDMLIGPSPTPDLIDSVKRFGILQPVILVESGHGKYRVADGRRRIKAARAAELTKIRAELYPANFAMHEVITLIGNGQRSQNAASDLDSIERLIKRGATEDQICEVTGLLKATLRKRMRLINLVPEMREAMSDGKMKPAIAQMVSRLNVGKQKALVKILDKNDKLRAQDVLAKIRADALDAKKLSPELFNGPAAPKEPWIYCAPWCKYWNFPVQVVPRKSWWMKLGRFLETRLIRIPLKHQRRS